MKEAKDVKFVDIETGEVLIEFDTLKVSDCEPDKEEEEDEENS